jgi:hypothetical protein
VNRNKFKFDWRHIIFKFFKISSEYIFKFLPIITNLSIVMSILTIFAFSMLVISLKSEILTENVNFEVKKFDESKLDQLHETDYRMRRHLESFYDRYKEHLRKKRMSRDVQDFSKEFNALNKFYLENEIFNQAAKRTEQNDNDFNSS